jgi:D-lactate dehydrogenase
VHTLRFLEPHLCEETSSLAAGFDAVCVFVNDTLNAAVLETIAAFGVRLIALRCAGFNNVDLHAAGRLGLAVVRVPAYSPHAVAEHAVGLVLALNRKLHRAYNRVREGNFALDGLLGFDIHGRTVGVVGTGRIGTVFAHIMAGFGCRVLAFDPTPNPERMPAGTSHVSLDEIFAQSDIISLHCPLTQQNHHLIDEQALAKVKPGVMLINTSRGALIDTPSAIAGLKSGRIGSLGLDVYEEEGDLFFEDLSDRIIPDDVFSRLLTFPNVIITGHQAFFTREALEKIASTTMGNIAEWSASGVCANSVKAQ